jgi:hypothetical protein
MSETGKRQYGLRDLPRGFPSNVRVQSQDVADGALNWRKMNFRHLYLAPNQAPIGQLKGGTGAVPSGVAGSVNLLQFTGQGTIEEFIIGTQTAIVPVIKTDGLEISGDQTLGEGYEFTPGLFARCAGVMIVGQDPPFFNRARIVVDDASGVAELSIGFRRVTNYTDFACLNLVNSGAVGQWRSQTKGGQTAAGFVDTSLGAGFTVADLGSQEVRISVSATGLVTMEVGGIDAMTTPLLAPPFTLADTVTYTPFIRFIHAADVADSVRLRQWEAGFFASSR